MATPEWKWRYGLLVSKSWNNLWAKTGRTETEERTARFWKTPNGSYFESAVAAPTAAYWVAKINAAVTAAESTADDEQPNAANATTTAANQSIDGHIRENVE